MNASFDSPDLERWMQDLVNAEARIVPAVKAIVARGALNVKRDAAERIDAQRSGEYLKHYPRSISYDVEAIPGGAAAEIGPDSSKLQGGMGPGVEYGSARHGPLPHLNPALDAEDVKFGEQLGRASVEALS
jgi:hypothetical protein